MGATRLRKALESTRRKSSVLCLLFVLLGINFTEAQAPPAVHFGDNIILLRFPDNQLINPHLSPHASYVVAQVAAYDGVIDGTATVYFSFQEANQYLWDLRHAASETPVMHLAPEQELKIDDSSTGPAFAFHPDEEFLAVATDKEVQLLSLPSLEVHSSISARDESVKERYGDSDVSRRLSWSLDGNILAILVNQEILAWDIEMNTINRHPLEDTFDTITATDTGWFVNSTLYPPGPNSFVVCTKFFETCELYEIPPDSGVIISQSGDSMIVGYRLNSQNPLVGVRYREDAVTYGAIEPLPDPASFCPRFFSPDSRYIVSKCSGDWTFLDLERSEIVFSVPRSIDLAWLPDNEYIISWGGIWETPTLRLYRFGERQPIDELDLEAIPSLEGIEEWDFDGDFYIQDISVDGRLMIANLGWAALVVPIVYE